MKVIKRDNNPIEYEARRLEDRVPYYIDGELLYYNINDWVVVYNENGKEKCKYYTNEDFKRIFIEKPKKILLD